MQTVWKNAAIQDRLSSVFDELISKNDRIQKELANSRNTYDRVCDDHINSGFQMENDWKRATDLHRSKFLEYDVHCYLIDMISSYRNVEGDFPSYQEMNSNIEHAMLLFAKEEKYEASAIIKHWLTKLNDSIV